MSDRRGTHLLISLNHTLFTEHDLSRPTRGWYVCDRLDPGLMNVRCGIETIIINPIVLFPSGSGSITGNPMLLME